MMTISVINTVVVFNNKAKCVNGYDDKTLGFKYSSSFATIYLNDEVKLL